MASASRFQSANQPSSTDSATDASGRQAVLLLKQAAAGDRAAYGRVVVMYQDRIYNSLLRMVGDRDEAAELTQEAFTRGLAGVTGFRNEAAPYTWLFRIAMNLAISRLRQVKRHRTFSLSQPMKMDNRRGNEQAAGLVDRASSSKQPDSALQQQEQAEQVVAALGRLDDEYRAVLVMRDVEGFDYQQMADLLELPLGTLKSRLFRARIALRDELKSYIEM